MFISALYTKHVVNLAGRTIHLKSMINSKNGRIHLLRVRLSLLFSFFHLVLIAKVDHLFSMLN